MYRNWRDTLPALIICLCAAACTDSPLGADEGQESLAYEITNQMWAGDLGFSDGYGYALESGVFFGDDGGGYDELLYAVDGSYATTWPFDWKIDKGTLVIDYENGAFLELKDTSVFRDQLSGRLFTNGRFYRWTTLYRVY